LARLSFVVPDAAEDGLERIERARADITEHDAEVSRLSASGLTRPVVYPHGQSPEHFPTR
jgi:hypothetical protein